MELMKKMLAVSSLKVRVDRSDFESFLVGAILDVQNGVGVPLNKVELAGEHCGEHLLVLVQSRPVALRSLVDSEVHDESLDLLLHSFDAATGKHCNFTVWHSDGALDVEAINFVLLLGETEAPLHDLIVAFGGGGSFQVLQVDVRHLDVHLRVQHNCKDNLLLPVHANSSCDVVTFGNLGDEVPSVVLDRVNLVEAILVSTNHENFSIKGIGVLSLNQDGGRAHVGFGHWRNGLAASEFKVGVELETESLLDVRLFLQRPHKMFLVVKHDPVLEVHFFESKFGVRNILDTCSRNLLPDSEQGPVSELSGVGPATQIELSAFSFEEHGRNGNGHIEHN